MVKKEKNKTKKYLKNKKDENIKNKNNLKANEKQKEEEPVSSLAKFYRDKE